MKSLFDEFPGQDKAAWLSQLQKDLKSNEVDKYLSTRAEGIELPVYLTQESLEASGFPLANRTVHHPEFEYANAWESRVDVETDDLKRANKRALHALQHGATSIGFTGHEISNQEELRLALRSILLDIAPIHFDCGEGTASMLFMYADEIKRMNLDPAKIKGSLSWDPLTRFVAKGYFDYSREESMQLTGSLVGAAALDLPAFKTISIHGSFWHNAGASAVQELAAITSTIAEYFQQLKNQVALEQVIDAMDVRMSSGGNYFIQIAKFRAMRILWDMLLEGNHVDRTKHKLWLQTETAFRNKTRYDAYSNLLRATTESMAAVIGGSDEHLIHPYNAHYTLPDEASRRYALNIHHLLREEARLDKVLDPSSGSAYIEEITKRLVQAAGKQFLETEEQGGFVASARSGSLQKGILEHRASIESDIRKRKRTIVGINQFADATECITEASISQKDPLDKLPEIQQLDPYFEAASFESLRRLFTLEKIPVAHLLVFGDDAKSKARASFASDYLASAGFKSTLGDFNVPLQDQVFGEDSLNADVLVLCSADELYLQAVQELNAAGWPIQPVLVAGNPESRDDLRAQGIFDFIFLGSDAVACFYRLLNQFVQEQPASSLDI